MFVGLLVVTNITLDSSRLTTIVVRWVAVTAGNCCYNTGFYFNILALAFGMTTPSDFS